MIIGAAIKACRVSLFLVVVAMLFVACSDKPSSSRSTAASTPASARDRTTDPVEENDEAAVAAADELALEEEGEEVPVYAYAPVGKRDPFKSPEHTKEPVLTAMPVGPAVTERLTPLQRWDLDQLQVRAIISATADPVAMMLDPEGHGHVVRRGMLIGKNWGRVTSIRRECVVVTEQMRDSLGTPTAVQQERCLPEDEREARFEEQMRRQQQ